MLTKPVDGSKSKDGKADEIPIPEIRKVASYDGKNFIQKLQFMDALSRVVYSYNPMNLTMDVTTYALGEGEKLIGVYGSKDVYFNF